MLIGAIALAFTAGVLSVLSPCVLPILPIVLTAAITDRKAGLVALAAGLSISFVTVGLFVATIGYSLGLERQCVSLRCGLADPRDWHCPDASATSSPACGRERPNRQLDRSAFWISAWHRDIRSVLDWRTARCRLEPMCRADARSSFAPGGAGPKSTASGHYDVRIWPWCGVPIAAARFAIPRSGGAMAHATPISRPSHQGWTRHHVCRDRCACANGP